MGVRFVDEPCASGTATGLGVGAGPRFPIVRAPGRILDSKPAASLRNLPVIRGATYGTLLPL